MAARGWSGMSASDIFLIWKFITDAGASRYPVYWEQQNSLCVQRIDLCQQRQNISILIDLSVSHLTGIIQKRINHIQEQQYKFNRWNDTIKIPFDISKYGEIDEFLQKVHFICAKDNSIKLIYLFNDWITYSNDLVGG